MRTILTLSLAAALFATGKTAAAEVQRKVAIIVENRADASLNDKVSVLEDLVTSRVAGKGFAIISRDVTLNALKTYTTAGVTADVKSATTAKATLSPDHVTAHTEVAELDSAKISATPDTTQLDQNLSEILQRQWHSDAERHASPARKLQDCGSRRRWRGAWRQFCFGKHHAGLGQFAGGQHGYTEFIAG